MTNLFAPSIFLDTSVVHGNNCDGAPFRLLVSLAGAGLLSIYFPELVKEEFRTQWREAIEKNVLQALKALSQLKGEHFLESEIRQKAIDLISTLEGVDLEQESKVFLENFIASNHVQIHPINLSQVQAAWSGYFSGQLPSKKIKQRSDIPDAHVMSSVSDFSKTAASVYFVSHDKTLLDSIKADGSIKCFPSLDELLQSKELLELRKIWSKEEQWQSIQDGIEYDEIEKAVQDFVTNSGGEILEWKEVRSNLIPDDNKTANIEMFGNPRKIEIGDVEDWGGGLLRYSVSYLSECLLGFHVFRADVYDVPDWVSVSYGDPETDHYFQAEAELDVRVSVDVTVRIEFEQTKNGFEVDIGEISFEESSLELELAMDEA